jgi:hypothetical protein
MNTVESKPSKGRITGIFALLRLLLETVFPSLLVLRIRSYVAKASFSENKWVAKQLSQCTRAALVLMLPSVLACAGIFHVSEEMQISTRLIERPLASLKKKQFKRAKQEVQAATSEIPLKSAAQKCLLFLMFPSVLSLYLRRNKILVETKRLQKVLLANGFGREGKMGLAVCLPIGTVIDISGHDPRQLVQNTAIWDALNIHVDKTDWEGNPHKRSVVLFKTAFILAPAYIYDLETK